EVCEAFAESKEDVADNAFADVDGFARKQIGAVPIKSDALTFDGIAKVYKSFLYDNPSYYWLYYGFSVSVNGDDMSVILSIYDDYAEYSVRAQCDKAIEDMYEECDKLCKYSASDFETAIIIHDYITDKIYYAYEADGTTPSNETWAHSLVGVAQTGAGVCEAYAKAFTYLCNKNGIDCISVVGKGGEEDHMWNMIKIDDTWYGVDVTWDDPLGTYNYLFVSQEIFDNKSMPHTLRCFEECGGEYLYDLPQLSDTCLRPVKLYKNDSYTELADSLEKAFEHMTDGDAEYTVELLKYGNPPNTVVIDNSYDCKTETLPNVKKITILGRQFPSPVEGYQSDISSLEFLSNVTLNSDLDLYDINIGSKQKIDIGNYTVTFKGEFVQFGSAYATFTVGSDDVETGKTEITGSANSKIISEVSKSAELIGKISIGDLSINDGRFNLCADAEINNVYVNSPNLSVMSAYGIFDTTVVIKNLYTDRLAVWKNQTLEIENLYSAGSDRIDIDLSFASVDSLPTVKITNKICTDEQYFKPCFFYSGSVTTISVDIFTGETTETTRSCNPDDIEGAVAYVPKGTNIDDVVIQFGGENGGDKTANYIIDKDGAIVKK
ncbi:MAG: hypothetical protein NC332_00535, partial [Firmicutes bacterium]|nr:hypothetical protein [Bacillota bacterium]